MSAKITYRFKITDSINNRVIGTGLMTASRLLTDAEQLRLFHDMSHNIYIGKPVNVNIFLES